MTHKITILPCLLILLGIFRGGSVIPVTAEPLACSGAILYPYADSSPIPLAPAFSRSSSRAL